MATPTFTYVPAPHERAYYGALFQAADTERSGSIGGAKAVEFFTRSKLPVQNLKQIWAVADRPPSNALDPRKFAVAVRLIQLEQNGMKPTGPDLAAVPGDLRPVFFEGIPVPSGGGGQPLPPQQPPPQQQRQPNTPPRHPAMSSAASVGGSVSVAGVSVAGSVPGGQLAMQDPYTLTPSEQARYEQIFPEYCKQDPNFMSGGEAVALFNKSGLSQQTLAQIWNMVDVPVDNKLDRLEFAIAMHLIVCVSKKNLPLPPGLPISLKQLKAQQAASQNGGSPPQRNGPPPNETPMATGGMNQSSMSVGGGEQGGIPSPIRVTRAPAMSVGSSTGMGQANSLSGMPGPPPLQPVGGGGGMNISDAFEGLTPAGDTGSISSYRASTPVHMTKSFDHSVPESNAIPSPVHQPRATVVTANEPEPNPAPARAPATQTTQQLASSYNMGEANEELEKLRSVLQKLQAENISLKAKLGTMGDEEKDIQKELSATVAEVSKLSNELTTLRAQVLASKSRLLEAAAELTAAKEKKGVITDLIAEASATKDAIDEAHAGIEKAIDASRAAPPPPPPATTEADLFGWGNDAPAPVPAPAPVQAPAPADTASQFSGTQSVESQTHSYRQQPQENNDAPQFSYGMPPAPAPAPAGPGMYNGGSYTPGHNRNTSTASGFGEVMGGTSGEMDGVHSFGSVPAAPSMEEVEILKTKSKEADDVAKSAEESRRQLTAQLDELRRVADDAESKARAMSSKPVKKKGLLGGRAQKKDAKEAQRLAAEARDKKDAMLQVQSQVKDAEALAKATKDEAERLNHEAEEAQMKAAEAASMHHNAPTQTMAPPSSQSMGPPLYGLGSAQHPHEQQSQAPKPVTESNGFGGQPHNEGFNSNVMGSGGSDIPTPSGFDDPYSNPFG